MTDIHQVSEDVLSFWFDETPRKKHFAKDPAFDAEIRARFLAAYTDIRDNGHERYLADARTVLAAILILDQFSRNMFRDRPEAFAEDARALLLTEHALATGLDQAMPRDWRVFCYMPLMHSERPEDHVRAVAVFETHGDAATLDFEHKHKAIIDRFGRYPHRNEILGRISTDEERAFLQEHKGF